ncbi:flocculation protein FLO11-like isoform X2 [Homarus americanus]|uniref:flocculation protein FLO11-like isoform X2 n=1 Tax=Homarus americanus TaxID=6706 RepID=UPI001C454A17|nr:flocculation protein FLO11-like isoform X2 [Homarus americanus]
MRVNMHEGGLMEVEDPLEVPPGHALVSHTQPYASSATASGGGGRIKVVRLIRRNGESYGFSLRGGREHGTGFFISHVESGSEAFLQGLRAGDQVLRVNNMCVEQAVHREVTAMVQSKSSVLLKLKSAGIIPLKEHRGDPLTWLVVDDDEDLSDHGTDSYSQSLPSCSAHESEFESFHHSHPGTSQPVAGNEGYARVFLSCSGKVGLGCSICKGPAEKPGIFVQSVRVGGVAKNAGLRPGDQILACNDISFAHLEFAEAVYVLKSSPRLALDVLRGAGLDLVAGESSGYNSSASSVAGDQTPPSSSSDPRDSDHSVTTRLSAVSRHLNLDRARGWREIESEWAEAEAEEKRRQLQSSQKTLKTRAQRDASHRLSSVGSRSLSNLSAALREEDDEEQRTAFRDGSPSYTHSISSTRTLLTPTHAHYKPILRSTRSSNDVTEDTNHKIALVTSADPHVNNIVVSGGPKDERDAVFRLDQLSSPSASRTSTLSSGMSQVTVRSSSGSGSSPSVGKAASPVVTPSVVEQQLRELREEQRRLKEEANRLAHERRKFEEEKRRGLERTQSAPLAPLVITCSGQSLLPHLQPPPSPTSSIGSGRHTTRVLIKSPPPPPPPRKNTTTLTSQHSSFQPNQVSPPASPAHSSSSSSGVGSSCGSGAPPRRCKSIGSLSASSGESAVWEELPIANRVLPVNIHPTFRSTMPPPTPPKPPAPPSTHSNSISGPPIVVGAPPPPPPPPPQPTSSIPKPSLAAALNRELERRSAQEVHLGLNGDDKTKAQVIEDKIDAFKKDKPKAGPADSKRAQHDKLMEEFKLAHKKMFTTNDSASEDNKEEKNESNMLSHPKVTRTLPTQVEISSRIISNSPINKNLDVAHTKKKVTTSILTNDLSPPNGINSKSKFIRKEESSSSSSNNKEIVNNNSSSNKTSSSTSVARQVPLPTPHPPPPPPPPPPLQNFLSCRKNNFSSTSVPGSSKAVHIPPHTNNKSSSSPYHNLSRPHFLATPSFSPTNNVSRPQSSASGAPPLPPPMPATFTPLPPAQWNERSGGSSNNHSPSESSALSTTKSPLRPVSVAVMEEFKPEEKASNSKRPPSAYFEPQRKSPGKPLVSIGAYPSPNQRPTPVKLEFLPTIGSKDNEINGVNVVDGPLTRACLQKELESTLSRSNLRQRHAPQQLPIDPPSSFSDTNSISALKTESTSTDISTATFTTTTIQNNAPSPKASLSTKYRGIRQDAPVTIIMKEQQ